MYGEFLIAVLLVESKCCIAEFTLAEEVSVGELLRDVRRGLADRKRNHVEQVWICIIDMNRARNNAVSSGGFVSFEDFAGEFTRAAAREVSLMRVSLMKVSLMRVSLMKVILP